jgi:hypothetical protein
MVHRLVSHPITPCGPELPVLSLSMVTLRRVTTCTSGDYSSSWGPITPGNKIPCADTILLTGSSTQTRWLEAHRRWALHRHSCRTALSLVSQHGT